MIISVLRVVTFFPAPMYALYCYFLKRYYQKLLSSSFGIMSIFASNLCVSIRSVCTWRGYIPLFPTFSISWTLPWVYTQKKNVHVFISCKQMITDIAIRNYKFLSSVQRHISWRVVVHCMSHNRKKTN